MEIGSYIKLNRIKQDMTQGDLADGIVSLSYLSKIENGKTDASSEVASLLCTRLGIELDSETDSQIKEMCQEWYKILFKDSDQNEIIRKYEEIQDLLDSTYSDSIMMFEIHKIRYYLVIGEVQSALSQINTLAEISTTFDNLHQYYWFKFKGNYNTVITDFQQAMHYYKQAEEKLNGLNLDEEEIADLHYTLAVTHSNLWDIMEVIDYAERALVVFRKEYHFNRCAECHIILGISYRRIRMYDKAIKNHNLAKHLGELSKNRYIIHLANHNLGALHSTRSNSENAIRYFDEVIQDEEIDNYTRMVSVVSIIKEYYSLSELDKASEMVNLALKLLDAEESYESLKIYYYTVYTYKYLLEDEGSKFEALVVSEFIPYLEKLNDYANIANYTRLLAKHYESLRHYKDAARNYEIANHAYEKLINI